VGEATHAETAAPLADVSRISLNQITINGWTLPEAVDGCARMGIGWIGLWRDKVADCGLGRSARLVQDAGLRVSSLCRGGFFPTRGAEALRARREDNRRAVDDAGPTFSSWCAAHPSTAISKERVRWSRKGSPTSRHTPREPA
jgi:sugar phosphate isomerase/epimerase